LGFDHADGLKHLGGGAGDEIFLLAIQQGEHFAVILQFVAQGVDQEFDGFHHEIMGGIVSG
jgi:hypothetical protein